MSLSTAGRKLGIGLVIIGAIQLATLSIAFGQGDGPAIFDVRRSLPLEPDEPVYHDFYINAGPEKGFRKGMYVDVVRAIPVHDPIQNKQQATLNIAIGKLHVIHVEKGITVARLHSEKTDEDRPTVEFEAVMIGDLIDMNSLTMEAPKSKTRARKKSALSRPSLDTTLPLRPESETFSRAGGETSTELVPVPAGPAPVPAGSEISPNAAPAAAPIAPSGQGSAIGSAEAPSSPGVAVSNPRGGNSLPSQKGFSPKTQAGIVRMPVPSGS